MMKNTIILFRCLICIALLLALTVTAVGCNNSAQTTANTQPSNSKAVTSDSNVTDIEDNDSGNKDKLRVIISSDVHFRSNYSGYYNVPSPIRLQSWVNSIIKEHETEPIDLLVIAGDTSLDYYYDTAKKEEVGTYAKGGVSDTKEFVDKYVSQLPEEIPVYILPGNHECYSNEKWLELTGNNRQETFVLENNLFIMLDTFSENIGSNYNGNVDYSRVDVDYVKNQIEAHPECNKVWLISHYFDHKNESAAFAELIKSEDKIEGLFSGHTHQCTVISMGATYGNKAIAQTGHFADSWYTSYPQGDDDTVFAKLKRGFWGFRELIISDEGAISNYISVATKGAIWKERAITLERKTFESLRYY